RSTVQVVADGPTEVAPDGPSLRRPLATGLVHLASVQEPTLHNSVAGHDDLVFVGEVTAVGSSRPVSTTVPTGPNADIPMPTYDFSPVEVRVVERLRVAPGADLPDPVRLRMIDMV